MLLALTGALAGPIIGRLLDSPAARHPRHRDSELFPQWRRR
jgi:hypothetical protein